MYRVYLRQFDGKIDLATKTITTNQAAAAEAFADLVNRSDLDGQKRAAVLTYNNRQVAFHRFDLEPECIDYWRGKLAQISWPTGGHGGIRENAGRRAATTDGGPLERKQVMLDKMSIDALVALGDGELSEGVRRAARIVAKRR